MNDSNKTYNERFKENQEKLKKRANELLSDNPDEDEPQFIGNPKNILDEDNDEKKEKKPNKRL